MEEQEEVRNAMTVLVTYPLLLLNSSVMLSPQ